MHHPVSDNISRNEKGNFIKWNEACGKGGWRENAAVMNIRSGDMRQVRNISSQRWQGRAMFLLLLVCVYIKITR